MATFWLFQPPQVFHFWWAVESHRPRISSLKEMVCFFYLIWKSRPYNNHNMSYLKTFNHLKTCLPPTLLLLVPSNLRHSYPNIFSLFPFCFSKCVFVSTALMNFTYWALHNVLFLSSSHKSCYSLITPPSL